MGMAPARDEAFDGGRGPFRDEREGGASGRRGGAAEVDVVLDREGQAPERLGLGIERSQSRQGMPGRRLGQADEGPGLRLGRGTRQALGHDLPGCQTGPIGRVEGGTIEGTGHSTDPARQPCVAKATIDSAHGKINAASNLRCKQTCKVCLG